MITSIKIPIQDLTIAFIEELKQKYGAANLEINVLPVKENTPPKKEQVKKIPTTEIRSNISLEQIMQEQNIQPISYEEIRKLAAEMEWEHSLEELLATLD